MVISKRNSLKLIWPKKAKSWADIFSFLDRINHSSRKIAGAAFETFCKHFLLTNNRYSGEISHVWLQKEVPNRIKKLLNLERTDYGYDLVIKTNKNKYGIVQCKFTSDQSEKKLNWTSDRLSSWLAASTKSDIRVLFTNASSLDLATIRKASEKQFWSFTLSHLLELSNVEINAILSSIHGRILKPKKFKPKPHQKKAIDAVINGFKTHSKGKLILPCGAGKTLTALWIKEQLKPNLTLVLVPSLALLRQFKDDWRKQESEISDYFCICSEKDIDSRTDSADAHISELASFVTTDVKTITKLLKDATRNTVIYSTYQSSPIVAKALRESNRTLDLVCADEAHRTAGSKVNSSFSLILDTKRFPARKKLFMTATPRIVGEAVKAKLGDDYDQVLADMNNEDDYGPEFYRMSFAEAIKQKILVDYRVLAVGISDIELNRAIKERRFAKGTTLNEIANHYAIEKVIGDYEVGHVVSFHSTVKKANEFAVRHKFVYAKTSAFHVNGNQPTSVRLGLLQEFKEATKAIITNARCLTEGIDTPKIDCVYFSDPKNSKIDIVQASGRALRRSDGKQFGYIVVPIFHREQNHLETEIQNGSFKNLISVVRAMADQDSRLAEEIKTIIYGKGKGKHSGNNKIHIIGGKSSRVELVGFERSLKKAIFSQVVAKSVARWRPFDLAKAFVHSLGLDTFSDWQLYCSGKLNKVIRPSDVPVNPPSVYKKAWLGWGDWLGTARISTRKIKYQDFNEARKFARSLKLKSSSEWFKFVQGDLTLLGSLPDDIPAYPGQTYKNKGWVGFHDWLETDRPPEFRSFEAARNWVRKLKLPSNKIWRQYVANQIKDKPRRPIDIPKAPDISYRGDGWISWADFLGSSNLSVNRDFRSFPKAREFVRSLGLNSGTEWRKYCKSNQRPDDIPSNPQQVYKEVGWKSWPDWLGTNTRSSQESYWSFEKARKFVNRLNLSTSQDWRLYCAGERPDLPKLPRDIPKSPWVTYKREGWININDWLGSQHIPRRYNKLEIGINLNASRSQKSPVENELITISELSKISGVSESSIKRLIAIGKIKPHGFKKISNKAVKYFFKRTFAKTLKHSLGITSERSAKLLTLSEAAELIGTSRRTLQGYLFELKVKPSEYCLTKAGITPVYKRNVILKMEKKLNVVNSADGNYFNASSIARTLAISQGISLRAIKKLKLKPDRFQIINGGRVPAYHRSVLKRIRHYLNITITDYNGLGTVASIADSMGVNDRMITDFIKIKKIKAAGRGVSSGGVTNFYQTKLFDLSSVYASRGITVLDPKGLLTAKQIAKMADVSLPLIAKYLREGRIQSEGLGTCEGGVRHYFKKSVVELINKTRLKLQADVGAKISRTKREKIKLPRMQ